MFDHITITASDYTHSRLFYECALATIGFKVIHEEPWVVTGFGSNRPMFWVGLADETHPVSTSVHIAFAVDTHELVNVFYTAAIAAGGRDNGPPGLRPQYHENYYAAFVLDPDGNNIEAVCRV